MDIRTLLTKIAENWPAKALSIALALALFIIHRMSILEERSFSAPLHIDLEPNIVIASPYPEAVQITARGDTEQVRSLTEEAIEAYVDLRGRGRGKYRAPIHFRKKGAAQSVEALEIRVTPLEISVSLDNRVSKSVPLKADIQGSVKQGYELVTFTLHPEQVVIDGPADLMTGIAELETETIELGGRSEDFSLMVSILNQYPFVTIRGTAMAEFRGTVREIMGLENFNGLPITPEGLSERFGADLEIKTGAVRLGGTPQELERFRPPDNFLTVDCSGITQTGTYTLPVSVRVPPGFTRLRQEPEQVTVRISSQRPR